jgi:biotin-dependent carboxylase-like uncharacterized protein
MSLRVVDPGLATTVQDHGRPGYRDRGVPPGGAFDVASADLANALLGNESNEAVLEMTLVGGTYEAEAPLALALAGAPALVRLRRADGSTETLTLPLAFSLRTGDRLQVGAAPFGARTYLAVRGGWKTPLVLGSRSSETRLRAGDRLSCVAGATPVRHLEGAGLRPPVDRPIRVIAGPDFGAFAADGAAVGDSSRVLAESDRVGLRLQGPGWSVPADPDRVSTPVAPGAVQAAGGQPLLLGVACGTMGGYPHVLHVVSADLSRVAQVRPGDRVRFELVTLEHARRLDREARQAHRGLCLRMAAVARD